VVRIILTNECERNAPQPKEGDRELLSAAATIENTSQHKATMTVHGW
jgi:hypothetical protein